MIEIKKFENIYLEDLKNLQITEFQKNYIHIDFEEILKMYENDLNTSILLVFNDNVMVGFACFLLDDDGDINLLKFIIDYRYQGKGYSKTALRLLLDLIKSSATKGEVWLSVHPQNTIAIDIFRKIGFLQQQAQYDADDEIFFKYSYSK